MNLRELLVKIGVDDSGTTEKLDKIDDSVNKTKASLLSLGDVLAGLGIGVALQRIASLADGLQNLQSRIDAAVGSHVDGLFETLAQHASDARMDVEAYTDSWSKFETGMRRLGYDVSATTELTDTLSAAFRVNGTEAQTAAGALFQLTQSIGSGSVQMEELNSFMDASPDLYVAVAESIGGTTTAFKKMVSQGKVSSKMLADAILAQNKRIMDQLRKMPMTLGDVWTMIQNDGKVAFKQLVVDTGILKDAAADLRDWWNEARQAWLDFVDSMGGTKNVAESIKNVLTPLAALLTILTGFKALSMLTSPTAAVVALAGAIGLLYDDYMVWKEGGTSLIDWSEWQTTLTQASNLVTQLTRDVNGLITSVKEMLGIDVSKWSLKAEIEDLVHQVHTLMNSVQGLVDTIKNISNGDFAAAAKSIQRMWNGQSFEEQMKADAETSANPKKASEIPGPLDRFAASPVGKMISSPVDALVDAYNWFRAPTPSVPSPIDVNPLPNNVQFDLPGGGNNAIGGVPQVTNNNTTNNSSPTYNLTINVPPGTDGKGIGDAALDQIRMAQGLRDVTGGQ
jgi:tape measure domain-containing protein